MAGFSSPLSAVDVDSIGDWDVPTIPTNNTLAKTLQEAIDGDTFDFDGGFASSWAGMHWPTEGGYTILSAPPLMISGGTLTFNLNGRSLDGTPLDIVSGKANFAFNNGFLGAAGTDFGFGTTGDSTVTLNTVMLNADTLQIGSGTTTSIVDMTGGSISTNILNAAGFGSRLNTNSTVTVNGNVGLTGGASAVFDGATGINGDVTVSGVAYREKTGAPGTYEYSQSKLSGSGILTFSGRNLSVLDGAAVDLSDFGGAAGYTVASGKILDVGGVFTNAKGGKNAYYRSILTLKEGSLDINAGAAKISGGAIVTGVDGINLSGGSLTVTGTVNDKDTGAIHQSEIELTTTGARTMNVNAGATVDVLNGGTIKNLKDITLGGSGAGTLNLSGVDIASGFVSGIVSTGTLTVGQNGTGTLTVKDGASLRNTGAMNVSTVNTGAATNSSVLVDGVSSGGFRSTLNVTGDLDFGEYGQGRGGADPKTALTVSNGALFSVGGTATFADDASSNVSISVSGRGGTGGGYDASLTTGGKLLVGNAGNVTVNVGAGGNITSGGATILAAGTGSVANVVINDSFSREGHYAWNAGGSATDYTAAPLGNSNLTVNNGIVRVAGVFAMAGHQAGYGVANFNAGTELRMAGGDFYNMDNATQATATLGDINLTGATFSGSGHVHAGNVFTMSGGTITPGGRWMYDFDRNKNDELTGIGTLTVTDRAGAGYETKFTGGVTFQTQLERVGNHYGTSNPKQTSDRVFVNGDLIMDEAFKINFSRVLSGDYLVVQTNGGTISGYTGKSILSNLATERYSLNLNGKTLKGNNRVDVLNGADPRLYSTVETNNQIWLHVDTLTGGNEFIHWTGETDGKWSMIAENFYEAETGNTKQFLDGDIVIFHKEWMTDKSFGSNTTNIYVTGNTDDYKGSVIVPEVRVLGAGNFSWNYDNDPLYSGKGSIIAYDSALYTTLDQASGKIDPATGLPVGSPSGQLVKIGTGTLTINNSNEFYGGVHLGGIDPDTDLLTTGGVIELNNSAGFGTYNSTSGFLNKGVVFVHESSKIKLGANIDMNNRFVVDDNKVLTVEYNGDFRISGNDATADKSESQGGVNGGKGGGIYIGDKGQVIYTAGSNGTMYIEKNIAIEGGGIYTKQGYTLAVPNRITDNIATTRGGGIYAERAFELNSSAVLSGNATYGIGGGIYVGYGEKTTAGEAFTLHGDSAISGNYAGGAMGGGIYVVNGRTVEIKTAAEFGRTDPDELKGGDVWFSGNYTGAIFDTDNPADLSKLDLKEAEHNAMHLETGAKLDITGPYNTYFYDPISGDVGSTVAITGQYAVWNTPNQTGDNANAADNLPTTQAGTAVFHGDSAVYGSTTVSGGATFRLEQGEYQKVDPLTGKLVFNGANPVMETVGASYGRRGSLAVTGAANNTFELKNGSSITGQGSLAADTVKLDGTISLDGDSFSQPTNRNGSGAISGAAALAQGTLAIDGNVTMTYMDTTRPNWILNLTGDGKTDQINVTGTAGFAAGEATTNKKLQLDIDNLFHKRYTILTASGGVTGYNANSMQSDASVYLQGYGGIDLAKQTVTTGDDAIYGRVKVNTYVGGTGNKNLYLDIIGRNRHVQAPANTTDQWGYDPDWTYTAGFDATNVAGSVAWSKYDNGPDTFAYVNGDMVTLHNGQIALVSRVNPVDLFVDGNMTITGIGFGITTFATTGTGIYGPNGTTILADGAIGTNDYNIAQYTGKLYKTGTDTLTFTNTGGNTFTGGIDIGTTGVAGGTIAFSRGDQLLVGTDKYINFLGSGTLNATATTALATDIVVGTAQTATFDVDAGVTLTQDGTISGVGAISKTDLGTLTLTAANDFSGGATLQAGTIVLGNDSALHERPTVATDPAANKSGQLDVTGIGTVLLDADRNIRNRFDVANGGALTFDLAGNTLNISGVNTSNAHGGVVRVVSGGSLAFANTGGNLVMDGNTTSGGYNGGTIYSVPSLNLSNLNSVAIKNGDSTLGSGGAIFTDGSLTLGTKTLVSGNRAGTSGGGVYVGQNASISGNTLFENNISNSATGGGAIHMNGSVASVATLDVSAGVIAFTGNKRGGASGSANAIYLNESSQIKLIGNGAAFNGVYFNDPIYGNNLAGNGVTLDTTFKGVAQFAGASILQNDASTTIEGGTMRLAYDSTTPSSYTNGSGAFTVDTGGKLAGGGMFASGGDFDIKGIVAPDAARFTTPTFNKTTNTFGAENTTIAAANAIGTLKFTGNVNMYGDNDPLSYQYDADLAASTGWNVRGGSDLLSVDGDFDAITGAGNPNKIVINLHNFGVGKFLLIEATNLFINGTADTSINSTDVNGIDGAGGAFDVTIHDVLKTDRHNIVFLRGNQEYTIDSSTPKEQVGYGANAANQLWLTTQLNNLNMYWTGVSDGTGAADIWQTNQNERNGNWLDKPIVNNAESHVENRDSVVFQDASVFGVAVGAKAIKLDSNVVVTNMLVNTNDAVNGFSFANNTGKTVGITTDDDYAGNILTYGHGNAPQKLVKQGTGLLKFSNGSATVGNTFSGGIVFDTTAGGNAGIISFNRANQLGDSGNGITFLETGTLRPDATGLTLNNKIIIAATKTATINTQAHTLTLSGLVGDETTNGALTKIGTGTLVLANTSNDYSGTTTVSAGTLRADGVGTLGSNIATHQIELANGATLNLNITGTETLSQQIRNVAANTTGIVAKIGAGTLTLDNTNTYSGTTNITGGKLVAETVGAINGGNTATVNMSAGTTLEMKLDGNTETGTLTKLLAGTNGNLVKSGNNSTLTLSNAGNTFTGTITVKDGTVGNISKLTANNATTLNQAATAAITLTGTCDHLEINQTAVGGALARTMTGNGRFIKSGAQGLTISSNNNFTGGTDLSAGSLTLSNVNALSSYTVAGGTKGQVDVTGAGTKTVALNTATNTTFSNHFNVIGGTFELTNVAGRNHTITLGAASNTNGGAVAVADNTTFQLNNFGTITFTDNTDQLGVNDVYLGGVDALLDIVGIGNTFFGSGIRGTGIVTKTAASTGITQIGAVSNIAGSTMINAGRFRINNGTSYTNTGAGNSFNLAATGTLEGRGTVTAPTITIIGKISPDNADLNAATASTGLIGSQGTLKLVGTTTLASGFSMDYDLGSAYKGGVFSGTTGDLLAIDGAATLNSGTVNFRGTLDTGKYLIVDADRNIMLTAGKTLDGINDTVNGLLKATINGSALAANSPRYGMAYEFGNVGGDGANSEIWLDVQRNTLTMDWKNTVATASWGSDIDTETYWQSKQWDGTTFVTVFQNGDYADFTEHVSSPADQTVIVNASGVIVSGMTFDSSKDITFTGGGITGRTQTANDTVISGKFVDPVNTTYVPNVPVDGKLQKSGTGTLTLNNANSFQKGTDLAQGKIVIGNTKALGTYDYSATDSYGVVRTTGTVGNSRTVDLNATGTIQNRFVVDGGRTLSMTAIGNQTVGGVVNDEVTGGAVYLTGASSILNIANVAGTSITFSNNKQSTNSANDIYVETNSTLNLTGAGNVFIDSGIAGAGTVMKTGTGITQIGAAMNNFMGTTNINGGEFHVAINNGYGNAASHLTLNSGGKLSGGGTIHSEKQVYSGTISPDDATYTTSVTAPTDSNKVGTLTMRFWSGDGDTIDFNGFTMLYDPGSAAEAISSSVTSTGDLLRIVDNSAAVDRLHTVVTLNSGTIRFTESTLSSGFYLIVDSDVTINLANGKTLDGINDTVNGVLGANLNGTALTTLSPRAYYNFQFADKGTATDAQIWLGVERNTLIMDWTGGATGTWAAGSGWTSLQNNDNSGTQTYDHVFNNGDYVHFDNTTAATTNTIAVDGNVYVSGFEVDGAGNTTFTGGNTGIIHAITANPAGQTYIEGKYLNDSTTPATWQVVPNGMLQKSGAGTLTFQNTGGNIFEEGILISGGTIGFDQANQLRTWKTAAATDDKGITFTGNATLQVNATGQNLANKINVTAAATTATVDTQAYDLTLSGVVSGLGAVTKTGSGKLSLTNTGNTYSGTTTVSNGTLHAVSNASGTALGNNVFGHQVVIDNASLLQLEVAGGITATLNQRILQGVGTGGKLEKIDGGEQILTSISNLYNGGTTVTAGTLTGWNVGSFGSNIATNVIDIKANATLQYDMHTLEAVAINRIIGAGSLIKTQTGGQYDLTLNNENNDFSGNITVTGTTAQDNYLIANDSHSLGDIASPTRAITLQRSNDHLTINENVRNNTVANTITGAGVLHKTGGFTTTLSGNNTFTGGTELTNGEILIGHTNALGKTNGTGVNGWLTYNTANAKTVTVASGISSIQNHLEVSSTAGTQNAFQNTTGSPLTVSGVQTTGNGGAGHVSTNAKLTVTANATMTFANNMYNSGTANDFYVSEGGELEFNGAANTFLNSGLNGTSTNAANVAKIVKSGSGTMQIGSTSAGVNDFLGRTTISDGTFRVVKDAVYGSNGAATYNTFTTGTASTVAGGGTIRANFVSIAGTISADSDTLNSTHTAVDTDKRFGTLTFDGDTTLQNGFVMMYDAHTDLNVDPRGDLLKVVGNSHTLTVGTGTVDLINTDSRLTGSYLIMQADTQIVYVDSGKTDPDTVLTATINGEHMNTLSVRGRYSFTQKQNGVLNPNGNQIWLDVEKNSLNMTWQNTAIDNVWAAVDGEANWLSTQGTGNAKERVFQNGDYVHFRDNTTDPKSITVDGAILVSGFDFDADTDYVFTGTGTIVATLPTNPDGGSIEGKYLTTPVLADRLTPDAKLKKNGSGILTFANGANLFREGIEISEGTVAFDNANQLGDDGKGISFLGDSTLRSNASITSLGNELKIADGVTATLDSNGHTFVVAGKIDDISGAGNLVKAGTGTVRLTNTLNAWSGLTSVDKGTLQAVGVGTLGDNLTSKTISVKQNAELQLEIAGTETLHKRITGDGFVTKTLGGTLVLDNVNDYTNGTTIFGGKVVVETIASVGSNVAAGVVDMKTGTALELKLETGEDGTFAQRMIGAGQLIKSGTSPSTLTLSRTDNDYTGNTDIRSGRIRITDVGAVGDNAADQSVNMSGSGTSLELSLTSDGAFDQKITGIGELVKTGTTTATLTNQNTFTGGTVWNGGNITLGNAEGLSKTNGTGVAGFVYVNTTGTLAMANTVGTIQNRFQIDAGKTLTMANAIPLSISNNDVIGAKGGAIELKNGASFVSTNPLSVQGNKTDRNGGAIFAPTESITIGGTGLNTIASLNGNTAGIDGGGIYAKAVTVKGGQTISGNTATTGRGGALYLTGGATSMLDATGGDTRFSGNIDVSGRNAVYMDNNVTLNLRGNNSIHLEDPISSNASGKNGNLINIAMATDDDVLNNVVYMHGNSAYYGDTQFDKGLFKLVDGAHFGATAADGNSFRQKTDTVLFGAGTVEASTLLLGGTLNAGTYSPPPRVSEIETLKFIGSTTIGDLTGSGLGVTKMFVDLNPAAAQKADLIDVTGTLTLSGNNANHRTLNDLDNSAHGKFLIAQTTGGVLGYADSGQTDDGRQMITDNFDTLLAGEAVNTYRFNIYYTVENGDKDVYLNVSLNQGNLLWNALNVNVSGSTTWTDDSFKNKWVNDPAYNWENADGSGNKLRYRQSDRVVFDSAADSVDINGNPLNSDDVLAIRKNIEILTHTTDTYATQPVPGDPASATVRNMMVLGGGTYRFTGRGINGIIDDEYFEETGKYEGGQLFVSGNSTVLFDNEANNFQRGIELQDGAIGFSNENQLGTTWSNDPENGGKTTTRGIFVSGYDSYGILYVNGDGMTLRTPIVIHRADSEFIVNTDGDDFGNDAPYNPSSVTGNYNLTIAHLNDGTVPADGIPDGISGDGKLVKAGRGTLTLADKNSYEGGTDILGGTVSVGADNRLGKLESGVYLNDGTLRVTDSFASDRTTTLGTDGGTLETDSEKQLTWNGKVTGSGDLTKSGKGKLILTNMANDYAGNTIVKQGTLYVETLDVLGANIPTRSITLDTDAEGEQGRLETNIGNAATMEILIQNLRGTGELVKSGNGILRLENDSTAFFGTIDIQAGTLEAMADFCNVRQFSVGAGATLCGTGILGCGDGGTAGGRIVGQGTVKPCGVTQYDSMNPEANPTAKPLTLNGHLNFDPESLYHVVITQYADPTYDSERMRPVNDCLVVNNGTVSIGEGALLGVEIDYWADNLSPFDFGETTSDKFTIIDAKAGTVDDPTAKFTMLAVELPRGVELEQGWNGSLYQLWFIGDPAGLFEEIGRTHNQKEVGKVLDYLTETKDPGMKELIRILSQKELTDDMVRDILSQLSGDLRANSIAMALKMPWRHPFYRIDRGMFPTPPDPCRPVSCRPEYKYKREFWGEGYGQYGDVRYDGNSYSHTIRRAGTTVGVDKQISRYSLLGAVFNYSQPQLRQATGSVKMDDYEIGIYNLTKLTGTVDLKSYFGYSHQDYDLRRHVYIPAGSRFDAVYDSYRNKTDGDMFSMSLELQRPFDYNDYVVFTPLAALDYEHVWQKGYAESGGLTALRYDNSQLERLMFRIGLNTKVYVTEKFDLFGRLQYATQLNRTGYTRSGNHFVNATSEGTPTMDVQGSNVGRDYINLGLGGEYYLNRKRVTSIYFGYDADLWKRMSSHSGYLGFTHRW